MVQHRETFRNKFLALKKRFNECVSYNMKYDDMFNGLLKKGIEFADLDMICQSIGLDVNRGIFYNIVKDKYDELAVEVNELLQKNNITYLIYNQKLERYDIHDYTNKVMTMIKQAYSQTDIHFYGFTYLEDIHDIIPELDDCVDKFWKKLKGEQFINCNEIYMKPYYFWADGYIDNQRIMSDDDFQPNTDYEISLEDIIYRAVLLTEVNYRFVRWIEKMVEE